MRKSVKLKFCTGSKNQSKIHHYFHRLISQRFDVILDDRNPDFVFYDNWSSDFRRCVCPRIFYTGENTRPNFNECDYAISFDKDIPGKNHQFLFAWEGARSLVLPDKAIRVKKTKFCNFIYSKPKCKMRNRFFHLLHAKKHVDAAGELFNNTARFSGRYVEDWKEQKIEFIRPYKFTIAFENSSYPGYITEKLFHAFKARTVPIYWGSPDVAEFFNPESFINAHDFPDLESLVSKVLEVDQDSNLYERYLQASPFIDNKIPSCCDEDRLLDFLEYIFLNPPKKTVGKSFFLHMKCAGKRIVENTIRQVVGRQRINNTRQIFRKL